MNCKPDQIAMIVRCEPGFEWSLGLTLHTTQIWPHSLRENPVWEFKDCDGLERMGFIGVADKVLMPIGNSDPDSAGKIAKPTLEAA